MKILVHVQSQLTASRHSAFLFDITKRHGVIVRLRVIDSLQNKVSVSSFVKKYYEECDYILSTTPKLIDTRTKVSERVAIHDIKSEIVFKYLALLPLLGKHGQELEEGNGLQPTTMKLDKYYITNITYAIMMMLMMKSKHVELLKSLLDD